MTDAGPAARESVEGVDFDPNAPLLEVTDLHVEFRTRAGVVKANDGVSYQLGKGETMAIVGESGSGKTVSAQAVMGIIDTPPGYVTNGSARFRGVDLFQLPESERRGFRGEKMAMIFQDALSALNPVFRVGWQIAEMYRQHRGASKSEARQKSIELLDRVKIPGAKERFDSYPHEFSGGMRQRAMIAMALALDPEVLIADEPTTALDVTVQAQIMKLLADLQAETGMGMILITHDLAVVAEVTDRAAVMYAGRIVEEGTTRQLFKGPLHPYTLGLMNSIATPEQKGTSLIPIPGSPPDLLHLPTGCPFHPRCIYAQAVCAEVRPPLRDLGDHRTSACHFAEEVAEVGR
ncbi:MAG TPA: ABC transporter ATP-binding protein [Acidimicrobiia bacterium]|nr:ABC transporter ATP-binding protein [Acidimicrobiia bacterium]